MIYAVYNDGILVNTIVSDEIFVKTYCKENNYTYKQQDIKATPVKPTPTELDKIKAQITYTALKTNTLIGGAK